MDELELLNRSADFKYVADDRADGNAARVAGTSTGTASDQCDEDRSE